MGKIKYFSRKTDPELQEKLNLLRLYGYTLSYKKGFLEIFHKDILVGYMKKSPHFVEEHRNIKEFAKAQKIYYQFEKHLILLDIPYLGDWKGSGMKLLTNPIDKLSLK